MSEAIVAKRYAEALFQIGNEKSTLDQLLEELSEVRVVFKENNDFVSFMDNPLVKTDQKKALVRKAFQAASTDVKNTIQLLVDRQRTELILPIIDHFTRMVNELKGIGEATVYSVKELSDKELSALEAKLAAEHHKKKMKLTNIVDPSILGGLRVRIGNTIYDGSVSGKLRRIERNISKVNN